MKLLRWLWRFAGHWSDSLGSMLPSQLASVLLSANMIIELGDTTALSRTSGTTPMSPPKPSWGSAPGARSPQSL